MTIVSLISMDDPLFGFENAMSHRNVLGGMWPLDRFSVVPYLLDPQQSENPKYRFNHTQAHFDMMVGLPVEGVPMGGNFLDIDPSSPGAVEWLTFNHLQEHAAAEQTLTPPFVYPFW